MPAGARGLTILEMLVSTALLSFIVLGLTAMFIQTQRAFKMGLKQSSINDSGRAVVDMIAADLAQLSDPHFVYATNTLPLTNPFPFALAISPVNAYPPPVLFWDYTVTLPQFFTNTDNGNIITRSNEVEDIFATVQTNATWMGIGYSVSNWFTNANGNSIPGVGTLYRYVSTTNGPIYNNNDPVWLGFYSNVFGGNYNGTLFHRVADGVVHLKLYAYDANGNEMYWQPGYDAQTNNTIYPNPTGTIFYLQYPYVQFIGSPVVDLPSSIDIEVGVLEPEAFEHARALYTAGAVNAASNYLATAAGQVDIYRQHIVIQSGTP